MAWNEKVPTWLGTKRNKIKIVSGKSDSEYLLPRDCKQIPVCSPMPSSLTKERVELVLELLPLEFCEAVGPALVLDVAHS